MNRMTGRLTLRVLAGAFALVGATHAWGVTNPYAPLRMYQGAWQVMQTAPVAKKPDQLINDCARIGRYFACQQTLNGKRGLLVVFIPDGGPGHYHTQVVLSDGNALGPPSTLAIAGYR